MEKENIIENGKAEGLVGKELEIFAEFFSQRFPLESDKITSYVREWARRFQSGSPERFMDGESLSIYQKLKGE